MLRTKIADRIVCLAVAVMLIVSVCMWGAVEAVKGNGRHEVGYESLLFDSGRVHTIDITMNEWNDFIAHATDEEYRQCNITIDGENIGTTAIRAKGNTSLSSVASLGSSRYSFKVEFDQYVKGKTYHGLDKLSLNNLIQDATMMKDYLAYTLMGKMGVPSPLCSYVQINVNGEAWGLYLAVEGVEDGFLERNGMSKGALYKPDSMSFGGGRGNGRDFNIENFRIEENGNAGNRETSENPNDGGPTDAQEEREEEDSFGGSAGASQGQGAGVVPPGTDEAGSSEGNGFAASDGDSAGASGGNREGEETQGFPAFPNDDEGFGGSGGGGFNFGMGSNDVKLVYTDDDPESYSNIFNNAKTQISTRDKNRLITSLKKLNAREDLDSVVNKNEVTTYLAVHNFLCNDDSYTGMMVHNYYLYEENGKLSIIPWDYNLGFGTFSAGTNATSTVNSPIDNPVSNGTADSRPLVGWIFSDEKALEDYHETYSRFVSECIENGWLESEINRVQGMITPYLERDSSAFYSMDDFEKAVNTLQSFCAKRGESIRGQLDGTIPSTTNGQRNSSALIDASGISIMSMGSMNGMGGGFGRGGGFGGERTEAGTPDAEDGGFAVSGGGRANSGADGSFGGSTGGMNNTQGNPSEQGNAPEKAPETGTHDPTAQTDGEAAKEETAGEPENAEASQQDAAEPENGSRGTASEDGSGGGTAGGQPETGDRAGGGFGGFQRAGNPSGRGYNAGTWIWTGACAAALLAAILIFRKASGHNS